MFSSRRSPRGFTVVELVVAVSLTVAVFAITIPFVRAQTRGLGSTASRLDAEQIARYAQRRIDSELRLASAEPGQTLLVYAGAMAISFNANLVGRDTTDRLAAEIDGDVDSSESEGWRVSAAAALPLVSRVYPVTDFLAVDGSAGRNETISYFLHSDTVTTRSDIYALWRRVNAGDSVLIVRGINVPEDSSFFSYYVSDTTGLVEISSGSLPLYWDSTRVDDITAVRIRSAGYYRNTRESEDVIRTVYGFTYLANHESTRTCSAPSLPSSSGFTITKQTASRPFRVTLAWAASSDDNGSGTIAEKYVIERSVNGSGVWTAVATVPARDAASYSWALDLPILAGNYDFALRVVGCDSESSSQKLWSTVTLP